MSVYQWVVFMSSKTIVKTKLFPLIAFIFIVTGCISQKPENLKVITATELNQIMQKEDIFLVDVHTPEQRHIKGTDLFIPYNEIEKFKDKLPQDKNTAIYLYCQSGPMGNAAADASAMGARNSEDLSGSCSGQVTHWEQAIDC
jgi:rhodanese-related sulfurtransferase